MNRPGVRFALVVAVLVAVIGGTTLVARARVQRSAAQSVDGVLARDGDVPAQLAALYPVEDAGPVVPQFPVEDLLPGMRRLEERLWLAAPRVPPSRRDSVHDAAVDVSRALNQANVLNLGLIYESIKADREGRRFELARVEDRYEALNRAENPRLASFSEVLSGDAARRAAESVARLDRSR